MLESWVPASQVAAAPTTKRGSKTRRGNDVSMFLSFYLLLYQDDTG
jgi:hypothetical protein